MSNAANNKRIAKNSMFLYLQMGIVMVVTLYMSRVILQSLGVVDFGIYNLVGGVVAIFNVIQGTMTDATQRFITFELGKTGNVNKVFSTSLLLHILIAVLTILIAEPVGLWFLYNKLIIPTERMVAAFWVFQCSLATMCVMIISIPYNAMIIAYEKMHAFAYISIVDVGLRLAIAYLVFVDFGIDRLILYAILMFVAKLALRSIYSIYCQKNIKDSSFTWCWDQKLVRQMGNFALWTILGNASFVLCTHGLSVILGMFFVPAVNAARGIASQVQYAFVTFVKNFQTAVNPQITKNYASGNLPEMHSLVFISSRYSYYLVLMILIPFFVFTKEILEIWLSEVPEYSVEFVRLLLVTLIFTSLINPLEVSIKATGNIRRFEIIVYGTRMFVIPIAYISLKSGFGAESVFWVALIFEAIAFVCSLIEAKCRIRLSIKQFIGNVVSHVIMVTCLAIILPFLLVTLFDITIVSLIVISGVSILWTAISVYLCGITSGERNKLKTTISMFLSKTKMPKSLSE